MPTFEEDPRSDDQQPSIDIKGELSSGGRIRKEPDVTPPSLTPQAWTLSLTHRLVMVPNRLTPPCIQQEIVTPPGFLILHRLIGLIL